MNIKESMKCIFQSEENFGETFYKTFFERCPEAADHFKGSDMKRQALILTMTMSLIEQYYSDGFAAVGTYLQYIGMRHKDRKIPPDLYPKMLESLLETLAEFHGDDWNEELAHQWGYAIELTSKQMLKGYDKRITI